MASKLPKLLFELIEASKYDMRAYLEFASFVMQQVAQVVKIRSGNLS